MGLKKLIVLMFLFLSISCVLLKDDLLSLSKSNPSRKDLNLNGYYIGNLHDINEGLKSIYFFYQNGVVHYGGGFPKTDDLNDKEDNFKSQKYDKYIKSCKTCWGVFQINGKTIKFETWEPSSGGPLKTVIRSGIILNDEEFVINSFYNNYNGKTSISRDTFHYNEFHNKPDSTNIFIQ